MDFSVKIARKKGIAHVPSFISLKSYFPSLDLEIDLLTLKLTLKIKIVQEIVYLITMT